MLTISHNEKHVMHSQFFYKNVYHHWQSACNESSLLKAYTAINSSFVVLCKYQREVFSLRLLPLFVFHRRIVCRNT